MQNYIEKYVKVGQGAWAAKALYDETVTSLLNQYFDDLEGFINNFHLIGGEFGGEAAFRKLKKAANILVNYGKQRELAKRCLILSEDIRHKPLVSPCIPLEQLNVRYKSEKIISSRIEEICSFLGCTTSNLEKSLKEQIELDTIPDGWASQVSILYPKAYCEWFTEVASKYLIEYLPKREVMFSTPQLKVIDWSSEVWRCWRLLDYPTLIDPGIFRPSQFFVWHIIHDSVHIWQMQAYGRKWSNILSPNEFLFLEAQAMCAERILLTLMQKSIITSPDWFPASQKSIILRLLVGLLEREVRLDLDFKVHLYGQNFTDWLVDVSRLTNLSAEYFQGLTAELLGMPGFCAAYTVVTDNFQHLSTEQRRIMLQEYPNISYEILGSIYAH